ncbi:MAG TPA: GGDEF domain-containing protein [Thermoanaerobaculia bacterium]|nr:GGDEF domain-containing protein [Thermoanaerobaculia bacterium]
MTQLIDPKVEEFLESIKKMTGHGIAFDTVNKSAVGPKAWEVRGEDDEVYGTLRVFCEEEVIAPKFEGLYLQLSHLIGHQIGLRQLNLTLESRFRLLDAQNAELAAINRALSDIAYRDPLTNLYRRWYLMEQFRLEVTRAARYNRPFSILMIDLDHFKAVNDTHGHAAGDFVLQGFSQILQQSCRTSDVLSRFGGDEFCVLLTDTPIKGATDVAERIRARTEGEQFAYQDARLRLTSSVGVGSYASNIATRGLTPETILEEIDQSMYRAKRSGRNAVQLVRADA